MSRKKSSWSSNRKTNHSGKNNNSGKRNTNNNNNHGSTENLVRVAWQNIPSLAQHQMLDEPSESY